MSNKAKVPNGYNSKSIQELQREAQQLLLELGQAHYNEEFSIREQNRIQERLEELENQMKYAAKAEADKVTEENNAKVRAEYAAKKESVESGSPSTPEVKDDQTVSNSGA